MEFQAKNLSQTTQEDEITLSFKFGMLMSRMRIYLKLDIGQVSKMLKSITSLEIKSWEEGLTFPSVERLNKVLDIYKIPEAKRQRVVEILQISEEASKKHKDVKKVSKIEKKKSLDDHPHPEGVNWR